MGCDYYILKVLYIYYNENDYLEIELERERCYYFYSCDSDEENYEEQINEYIKDILTPKMKPIILYSNNNFTNSSFEIKYKTIVVDEINRNNKQWCDIHKIIKVEKRYKRG
jgi:hypothetical protein